nr:MAG TPA: hypothetical protein [Bacteriophage sp.]
MALEINHRGRCKTSNPKSGRNPVKSIERGLST